MFLLCFCDDDELSVVPSRSRLLFAGRRETLGTRLVWVNYCYWLSSLPSRASRLSSGFSSLASRFSLVPCSLLTLGRMGSCPWKNMWRRQIRSDEMYSYLQLFHLARPQSSLTSPWWRQTYMMHYPPRRRACAGTPSTHRLHARGFPTTPYYYDHGLLI